MKQFGHFILFLLFLQNTHSQEQESQDEEEFAEGDILGFHPNAHNDSYDLEPGAENSASVNVEPSPWPNGKVPYIISDGDFTETEKEIIVILMEKFSDVSCIVFKLRVTEATYIHVKRQRDNRPCSSHIGYRNTGPRELYLKSDCMDKNGILHELMHALGFWHEHNRADRDKHVTINLSNVDERYIKNFQKRSFVEQALAAVDYDCNSVTHYPHTAFAKDQSNPTIKTKSGQKIHINGLSRKDILKVKLYYRCEMIDSLTTKKSTLVCEWNLDDGLTETLEVEAWHGELFANWELCSANTQSKKFEYRPPVLDLPFIWDVVSYRIHNASSNNGYVNATELPRNVGTGTGYKFEVGATPHGWCFDRKRGWQESYFYVTLKCRKMTINGNKFE